MEPNFKILDVFVPLDDPDDVLSEYVWPILCPEWNGKALVNKPLSGGVLNYMRVVHAADDGDLENALVVRLQKTSRDAIQPKYDEFIYMQVAHHAGCFSKVRAVLRNGLIYNYIPGKTVTYTQVRDPEIAPQIARSLAKLHWVDTTSLRLLSRTGELVTFPSTNNHINRMREVIGEFTSTHFDPEVSERIASLIKLEELEEEITFVENYLSGLDLPTANTHEDFHVWNMLYDEKSGQVSFLDYEFSGYQGLPTNDLTLVLDMATWKDIFPDSLSTDDYPDGPESDDTKRMWLTAYLEQKHELEGKGADDVSGEELELWLTMLQITDVLMYFQHLFVILSSLQFNGGADFTFAFYEVSHQVYHERKPRLGPLREKYLHHKSKFQAMTMSKN